MKQRIGFIYRVEHLGRDGRVLSVETVRNLMPDEALRYVLAAAMTGGTAFSNWHLGLFANERRPLAADTAESFLVDAGEIDTYDGDARPPLTFAEAAAGSLTTMAAPNVFSFADETVVQGAFITPASAFGATDGPLLSAALFNAPKTIGAGEALRVPAGVFLVSA